MYAVRVRRCYVYHILCQRSPSTACMPSRYGAEQWRKVLCGITSDAESFSEFVVKYQLLTNVGGFALGETVPFGKSFLALHL